jgi:ATP-dependent RNA/DNA helicase IGHMBP2
MTQGQEYIAQLVKALKEERDGEFNRFKGLVKDVAVSELKKSAACWFPLKEIKRGFGLASNPFVIVRRNPGDDIATELKTGQPVAVFSEDREQVVQGIILAMDNLQMKIGLNAEEFPDWLDELDFGVMEYFDPKSFDEMERALSIALNAEKGRVKELRETFHGSRKALFREPEPVEIEQLNESQKTAVSHALASEDICIIHGPPGTGKTTTLIEIVRRLVDEGERVLVSAPSNAAVDLLAHKCGGAGLDVMRVGRLSRIDDKALEYSLDLAVQKTKEYKEAEQYKRRSQDLFKQANKFKRSFGPDERRQRTELRKEARDLKKQAKKVEEFAIEKCLDNAQVVAATLVGSSSFFLWKHEFNTVVIDEAGQALEPSTWIPINKAQRVILAGDPFQLPPTVKTLKAEDMGLRRSLIEVLIQKENLAVLLNVQYRMNTTIMGFSNQWFYQGELKAATQVSDRSLDDSPLEFIDTAGAGFEEEGEMSKWNDGEVDILRKHLQEFDGGASSIGVISPYAEQVRRLQEAINGSSRLSIHTVDSFQGQERDVIYISLVRNNERGEIGFLKDYRRMNVAMTRARKKLVVIGDSATIGQDKFYEAFLTYVEEQGTYRSAWEFLS